MKTKSFKTQLLIYGGGLVIFIAVLLLSLFSYRINSLLEEELVSSGEHLVNDFSYASELGVASEDPVLLKPFAEALFEREEVILIASYNEKGIILLEKKEQGTLSEQRISSKIKERLEKERGVIRVSNKTEKGSLVYDFYAPVLETHPFFSLEEEKEREVIGFSKITISLDKKKEQTKEMMLYGFFITFLATMGGFFILFLLSETLTKPLFILKEGVDIIGRGNLNHRVEIKTQNEIEELAQSFNKMVENLQQSQAATEKTKEMLEVKVKERTKELQELTGSLEEKVSKKTEELQKRVNELEKFYKITVGRELKMIELKKKIDELEKNK
ncbi:MAG: HAMP domain-containing protein [Candidatus Pacebacteria bacterium]|nr:HAMP domain-containing protein [Candidatus Paceibacterota bacterium]